MAWSSQVRSRTPVRQWEAVDAAWWAAGPAVAGAHGPGAGHGAQTAMQYERTLQYEWAMPREPMTPDTAPPATRRGGLEPAAWQAGRRRPGKARPGSPLQRPRG